MKKLECNFWILIGVLTGTPIWAEINGRALAWWKSRLKGLRQEEIEAKYHMRFLLGCEMFGDDRVKSFEFFKLLQKEKNEELSKL